MRPGFVRRDPLAMVLLLGHLFQEFNHHGIPPLTLGTIILQIFVHFRGMPFQFMGSSSTACLSAHKIINQRSYINLFTHAIVHADDWHLYYNMVSFLVKGKYLENRMGASLFGILLALFTLLTGLTYVGIYALLGEAYPGSEYIYRCAVGFSGVIFALKVITTYESRFEESTIFGVPIGPYSVWVELILISVISRNASFVGHLAGIFVGLAYIYGPLKYLIHGLHGTIERTATATNRHNSRSLRTSEHTVPSTYSTNSRPRFYGGGTTRQRPENSQQIPSPNAYTPPGMDEEEQIRRATAESIQTSLEHETNPIPSAPPLSSEELRQRRLQMFSNFSRR